MAKSKKVRGRVIEMATNPITGKNVPVRIGELIAPKGCYLTIVSVFYDGDAARSLGYPNLYPWKVGAETRVCQFQITPFDDGTMERFVTNGFKYEEKIPSAHPQVELGILVGTDDEPRTDYDPTASEATDSVMLDELNERYAARNPRLVEVNEYSSNGLNPRRIQDETDGRINQWTARDDKKRILKIQKEYFEEI